MHNVNASRRASTVGWVALLTVLLGLGWAPARADEDTAGSDVGRISVLRGNVTIQRGDSGDTVAATVNAPVTVGDYLATSGTDSRAEVQIDANDLLRIGTDSQLRFSQLDATQQTVQVAAGTVELRIFKHDIDPEVDTPSIGIRPDVAGSYRVSVDSAGVTTLTVRSGSADLLLPQGPRTIQTDESVEISGNTSAPVIRQVSVVGYDSFDSWNTERDQYVQQAPSSPYVNANMVGVDDLATYGHWVYVPDYGNAWVPYAVASGWAPYHYGRWVWEPYYGWTWVGYEPWGWAPYHYGRWFYSAGYGWAWYPGPVYVRPVYRPGMVAFFGFGGGGTSFSLAFGNVGWVPLAPYEPFHPWWGPTVVNRTVVNVTNVNITNVNVTHIYRNAAVAGGAAVVTHENFTNGGAYHYVAVRPEDLHSVALVKSTVPVVPTRQNLAFTKVDAEHPVTAAPLSSHFDRLAAPSNPPPSFDKQRLAVQATTQHAYHMSSSPGIGPSAWDRFNSGHGTQYHQTGSSEPTGGPHGRANDQWTKFSPQNNPYADNANGTGRHAANAHHGGAKQKQSNGKKPSGKR